MKRQDLRINRRDRGNHGGIAPTERHILRLCVSPKRVNKLVQRKSKSFLRLQASHWIIFFLTLFFVTTVLPVAAQYSFSGLRLPLLSEKPKSRLLVGTEISRLIPIGLNNSTFHTPPTPLVKGGVVQEDALVKEGVVQENALVKEGVVQENLSNLNQIGIKSQVDASIQLAQGRTLYEVGRFAQAASVWQQAAQGYEAQNDYLNQALSLSYLALAYQDLGQWQAAEQAISQSLEQLNNLELRTQNSKLIFAHTLNTQVSLQLAR